MSESDHDKILGRLGINPAKNESRPESIADESYKAFEQSEHRQTRLRILYKDGIIGLLSYSYLMEVLCTSHQFISLIYTNCAITIEGRNLLALLDALQDETVRVIRTIQPAQSKELDKDAPVIHDIKRKSLQEKSSPSANG